MRISERNRTLDAHYQKEIKAKEQRIKDIKESYNKKIQEIKESGNQEVRENREIEREKILKELEYEKEKWEELRNKWKEKEGLIEATNRKKELEYEQEINLNRAKHAKQLELEEKDFSQNLKSLEERGNKALSDIDFRTTSKLYEEQIKSRGRINSLQKENERMEDLAIRSYSDFNSAQQREINKAIAEKERERRFILKNATETNSKQIREREKINQYNLSRMEEMNQNKIENKEKSFQNRMEQIERENQESIKNYSERAQKEINKMKLSETKEKDLINSRTDDPFYTITTLNPKISENEKEYILTLSIPEHEKDSILLGADGRSLKISQTRRFSDESKNPDGTINKSSRSEVLSQIINLNDLVSPRQITHSYQDNELIFKIPKA